MAESYGQDKTMGHSHGPLGHGGHHRVGGHGMDKSNGHMDNPHTMGHGLGHTMSNEHGGSFGMGI
jgi:hypothetical protein